MLSALESKHGTVNQAVVDSYFAGARSAVNEWGAKLDSLPVQRTGMLYRGYWNGYQKLNGTA